MQTSLRLMLPPTSKSVNRNHMQIRCVWLFLEMGREGWYGVYGPFFGKGGAGERQLEWIVYIIACLSLEHLAKSPKAPL